MCFMRTYQAVVKYKALTKDFMNLEVLYDTRLRFHTDNLACRVFAFGVLRGARSTQSPWQPDTPFLLGAGYAHAGCGARS